MREAPRTRSALGTCTKGGAGGRAVGFVLFISGQSEGREEVKLCAAVEGHRGTRGSHAGGQTFVGLAGEVRGTARRLLRDS